LLIRSVFLVVEFIKVLLPYIIKFFSQTKFSIILHTISKHNRFFTISFFLIFNRFPEINSASIWVETTDTCIFWLDISCSHSFNFLVEVVFFFWQVRDIIFQDLLSGLTIILVNFAFCEVSLLIPFDLGHCLEVKVIFLEYVSIVAKKIYFEIV
jgi:hypothetical protein